METNLLGIEITHPTRKVYVFRGIPGSGKSTLAKKMQSEMGGVIYSTDDVVTELGGGDYAKGFNMDIDGMKGINKAHSINYGRLINSEDEIIYIDNTNIRRGDIKNWVTMFLERGYDEKNMEIVDVGTGGLTLHELYKRQTHDVPMERLQKFWTSYHQSGKVTIENIMDFNKDVDLTSPKIKFIDVLNQYQEEGWIIKQKHPELDLYIWNYTIQTTFENHWNNITLMCRSLVTDSSGNIISRGFGKFFNYSQIYQKYDESKFIGSKIFEKLDGSYIGIFWYDGKWIARSKGSFITEQANKAIGHFNNIKDKSKFSKQLTHNFEVIYPENRIVVDYGDLDTIVYLATTDLKGNVFRIPNLPEEIRQAKIFDLDFSYEGLKAMDDLTNEGFVCITSDNMLFKIKFDDYLMKHAIVTETSSYDVWKAIKEDRLNDMIKNVPDEFYNYVKDVKKGILDNKNRILNEIQKEYDSIENKDLLTTKEFAFIVKNFKHKSHMFRLFRGDVIDMRHVWLSVKPTYSKPSKGC